MSLQDAASAQRIPALAVTAEQLAQAAATRPSFQNTSTHTSHAVAIQLERRLYST